MTRAVSIRPVAPQDCAQWLRMRLELWPDSTEAEIDDYFERAGKKAALSQSAASPRINIEPALVLVAERAGGGLCGFVEMSFRSIAEGCWTSPVAYVEGWYVDADMRRSGVGRALIEAAERWAREQGAHEMGSDALIDNAVSHAAHKALGFSEVERNVCFAKRLES